MHRHKISLHIIIQVSKCWLTMSILTSLWTGSRKFPNKADPWPTIALLAWLSSIGLGALRRFPMWEIPAIESKDPKPRSESPTGPVMVNSPFSWPSLYKGEMIRFRAGSKVESFLGLLIERHHRWASTDKLLKRSLVIRAPLLIWDLLN